MHRRLLLCLAVHLLLTVGALKVGSIQINLDSGDDAGGRSPTIRVDDDGNVETVVSKVVNASVAQMLHRLMHSMQRQQQHPQQHGATDYRIYARTRNDSASRFEHLVVFL